MIVHVVAPADEGGECARCGAHADELVVYALTDTLHAFRRACARCAAGVAAAEQSRQTKRRRLLR